MNLQLTLAVRYLAGRKLRTFLTTLAILFGVLLIFGMNTILPTMIAALQANVQGGQGQVDFTITSRSGGFFPAGETERITGLDGVRAVSGALERTLNLPADFIDNDPRHVDRVASLKLIGFIPERARALRSYPLISGSYLKETDTDAALITQTLADELGVKTGDTFRIPSAGGLAALRVAGIMPATLTPGAEDVLVNLPEAQSLTGQPGRINVMEVDVEAFAGEARRAEVQRAIETALGDQYSVGALAAGDELFAAMELGKIGLSLFGVLALFMGGFIIFNTFRTLVSERRRDIGMLRALGATRGTILGMILAEGLLQGLAGSLGGLVLGYLLGFGVLRLAQGPMSTFINVQLGLPVVSAWLVIVSILLGVGVTVVAGLLPALQASRVTPLEALRPSLAEVEFNQGSRASFFVGLALVILTTAAIFSGQSALIIPGGFLFLLGLVLVAPGLVRPFASVFGRLIGLAFARQGIGGLAHSNLVRQPSRVAVTVSASMLGLAVIVAAGGLVTSMTGTLDEMLHRSLGSDYLFVPPSVAIWASNVGAKPALAESLRRLDEVQAVSTLRFSASQAQGQAVSVIGIEPDSFQQVSGLRFIQGSPAAAYRSISAGRELIANGAFLTATGKQVGDSVDLIGPAGALTYHIAAAGDDLLNAKITTAYISQDNLLRDFGSDEDVFLQLNLKAGADRAAANQKIHALAADYPQFKLISGSDYFASIQAQMKAAFSGMYIMFLVLAVPSLIAMLNTLTIGVIERTREIGMLRAVGATRRQIRALVVAEALLLAAIGTAFGILGGMYLGYVFVTAVKVIFPMGYFFPQAGILAAVAIGLLFGALAAFIPARQAARMNVVEALRYE